MNQEEEIRKNFGDRLRMRVCGILIEHEKLLLVKHTSIGALGYLWAPPGGGMHYGESASETLEREFLEETGLRVEVGSFLFVNEFLSPPLHGVELFFEVRIKAGQLKKGFDPEMSSQNQIIEEVRYVSFEEMEAIPPLGLHGAIRDLGSFTNLIKKIGYFLVKS